jgi:hypothetical protein
MVTSAGRAGPERTAEECGLVAHEHNSSTLINRAMREGFRIVLIDSGADHQVMQGQVLFSPDF